MYRCFATTACAASGAGSATCTLRSTRLGFATVHSSGPAFVNYPGFATLRNEVRLVQSPHQANSRIGRSAKLTRLGCRAQNAARMRCLLKMCNKAHSCRCIKLPCDVAANRHISRASRNCLTCSMISALSMVSHTNHAP